MHHFNQSDEAIEDVSMRQFSIVASGEKHEESP